MRAAFKSNFRANDIVLINAPVASGKKGRQRARTHLVLFMITRTLCCKWCACEGYRLRKSVLLARWPRVGDPVSAFGAALARSPF